MADEGYVPSKADIDTAMGKGKKPAAAAPAAPAPAPAAPAPAKSVSDNAKEVLGHLRDAIDTHLGIHADKGAGPKHPGYGTSMDAADSMSGNGSDRSAKAVEAMNAGIQDAKSAPSD